MKRMLSFLLASLSAVTLLASCYPGADRLDPAITVASSDAETYAEWLDTRLETIPDNVILGIGSNEAYGVDMSNFESDGYILREIEGNVLIFGATADGADRAVRKYAKAVERGQNANLDEVYHEGYRIGKITLAGRDISEYTVYHPDEANMKKGVDEFVRLIEKACGVKLSTSAATPAVPYIEYKYVADESLSTVGYRYSVTADGMVIECSDSYNQYSPLFATWRILENELDWFGLTYGDSDLTAAELVDISAGSSGTETPAFEHLCLYGVPRFGNYDTDRSAEYENYAENNYSPRIQSSHGLQVNKFGLDASKKGSWDFEQPCYTDDFFLECTISDVSAYIDRRLAAGAVVGEDFVQVDVAAGDNGYWCLCNECKKVFRMDGNAYSGSVVQWANKLSEALNAVPEYEGITYGIFAYCGTNKPPEVTVPNELIYVTYCFDWNCSNHPIDGSECVGDPHSFPSQAYNDDRRNNTMSGYLEGWLEKTDNIYVWYYVLEHSLVTASYLHNTYEDFNYLHDVGVKGIFRQTTEAYECGIGTNRIAEIMWSALQWDPDMTEEEYDAYYLRLMKNTFGEGWDNVCEYYDFLEKIYSRPNCYSCWGGKGFMPPYFDPDYYAENYDYLYELIEDTIPLADSALQERWFDYMSCDNIYKGSVSSYIPAYEAYDDERVEVLKERYALIDQRLSKYGVDMNEFPEWTKTEYYEKELEYEAWHENTETLWRGWMKNVRPKPEHVAEYFETSTSAE